MKRGAFDLGGSCPTHPAEARKPYGVLQLLRQALPLESHRLAGSSALETFEEALVDENSDHWW